MMNYLPTQPTTFVGRKHELTDVNARLTSAECRLLTLTGLGGSGKTRLAIEAARTLAPHFSQGVVFVGLQQISRSDLLVPAIAQALRMTLYGKDEPETQLINYLREKSLLLLLDNFEHLLAGTPLVSVVLEHAPNVKILANSREALNLQEEWLYPLKGMSIPLSAYATGLEDYEAVQLFLYHAYRTQPGFDLAREYEAVISICAMTAGLPLGIELAAAWLKGLTAAQIAAEMQHNLSFLSTTTRNVEERHRSIRAVFDQTWKLLSEDERLVFARLSVFRGGFDREAAEQVAGATLSLLVALVEKSLINKQAGDRWDMHELLRQYARAALERQPELAARTRGAHTAYYADFVASCERALWRDADQQAILLRFESDIENARSAWSWALESRNYAAIEQMLDGMGILLDLQSRLREGAALFESAAAQVGDTTLANRLLVRQAALSIAFGDYARAHRLCESVLTSPHGADNRTETALALCTLGISSSYLGDYAEAEETTHEAMALYTDLDNPQGVGRCLCNLGYISVHQGDFRKAKQLYSDSIAFLESAGDRRRLADALCNLGIAIYTLGDYIEAKGILEDSLAEFNQIQFRRGIAKALDHLGVVHFWGLERYDEARHFYEQSLAIRRETGDQQGVGLTLNNLGDLAIRLEQYEEAKRCYEACLQIKRKIGDHWGEAMAQAGLIDVTCLLGDYTAGLEYARESLHIALELHAVALVLGICLSTAVLFGRVGALREAGALFELVVHHPDTASETRKVARQRFRAFEAQLPAPNGTPASRVADLRLVTNMLGLDSNAFAEYISALPIPSGTAIPLEPLTPREIDVLRLMAAGLTNPQIAAELVIGMGTVKTHTLNIYRKLDVGNRTQAMVRAQELGLLPW